MMLQQTNIGPSNKTEQDSDSNKFSILSPKIIASYIANSALGTLRIPGLQIPDVGDGGGFHRAFNEHHHRILAWATKYPPISGFRCLIMDGAMLISHAFGEKAHSSTPAYQRPPEFIGPDGHRCQMTDTICFMGSGLDEHRKPESAAKEYLALREGLNLGTSNSMYVYQSDWRSSTLSPAWFQRLYDAYRLNIDLNYYSLEARNFVNQSLRQRISEGEQRIDLTRAVDNMRLNLIGQSFGGTFCRMISNSLKHEMRNLGYKDNEIQKVFDNVIVINVSGASRVIGNSSEPMFKEIFVEHIHDFICWQTDRSNIHPYFVKANQTRQWIQISDRTLFLWSDFTWGNGPDQVPRPVKDSYGFHTVEAMTKSPEMQLVRCVAETAVNCTKSLPPLTEIIKIQPESPQVTM